MRNAFLIAVMLWSAPVAAQNTKSLAPGAKSPAASIDDISWLVGNWEGEGLGGRSFETVSAPVAGQMAAHFQQVNNGALQFYEFYQFVPKDGSILLRLKHFNPDLSGWEEKNVTVDFPLVAIEKDAIYFDGLTMRRVGEDGFETHVLIGSADKRREAVFRFRRVGK